MSQKRPLDSPVAVSMTTDLDLILEHVPDELREYRQWVAWRLQERNGKPTKVPYDPIRGRMADCCDPATWGGFNDAIHYCEHFNAKGVGFVFTANDPFTGIDLDKCREPTTGNIEGWANEIIDSIRSYSEVSPSRTGVKIIVRATKRGSRCRKGQIEIYDRQRYFTLTGNRLAHLPGTIQARQRELEKLYEQVFGTADDSESDSDESSSDAKNPNPHAPSSDDEIVRILERFESGPKFKLLWSGKWEEAGYASHSEADLALVGLLAFMCGHDSARIDRLYRRSGLYRDKWERHDYRRRTIEKALAGKSEFFTPSNKLEFDMSWGNAMQMLVGVASTPPTPRLPPPPPVAVPTPYQKTIPSVVVPVQHPVARVRAGNPYAQTDMGNAERFVALYTDELRYVSGIGWFEWDGQRWREDHLNRAVNLSMGCIRHIYQEAAAAAELAARDGNPTQSEIAGNHAQALSRWAKRSEAHARIIAVPKLAATLSPLAAYVGDLDRDPWLFNCRNGTLDLRTGALRPHRRDDLITKVAPVDYDTNAECPIWIAFLQRIFDGNQELIDFVQLAVGYALTGVIREHVLHVLYGGGANGKSTLLETVSTMLGDYAKHAAPGLLIKRRYEGHPTELADLRGARLVTAIETAEGGAFDEERVKSLTGGDRITARRMRQDFFEFTPTFKLFLATNHRPVVKGDDNGIWRRLRLWPFNVEIPAHEQDVRLKEKLLSELPGILAWCVRGCKAWRREGLGCPTVVTEATQEYRDQLDQVGMWLEECCERPADNDEAYRFTVQGSDLYGSYKQWCDRQGVVALSNWRFSERMLKVDGVSKSRSHVSMYHGVRLIDPPIPHNGH